MAKRPLIDSGPVSEFGETDPSLLVDDRGIDFTQDMMYVPGFSDQRRQRELEMLEYHQGTRSGKDVSHLGANVYWTRRTTVGGATDARKLMGAKNAGYQPVTKEMVGTKPWLTGLGAGWTVTPEGHILNAAGDYQLMYLEGKAAANRAAVKEKRWLDQSSQVQAEAQQEGALGGTPDAFAVPETPTPKAPAGKGWLRRS